MTSHDAVLQSLALCTQRPGHGLADARLSAAIAGLSAHELVDAAEHHGLDPLLFAHLRAARVSVDPGVLERLRARYVQQAHACGVRDRVMSDVLTAMERSHVRLLVLKGAALAHLAYADPRLRPMRDVDLLVQKHDLRRAHDVLIRGGFTPCGRAVAADYHHLPGLSKTVDGATVTIELHHELLPRTPFLSPLGYDDLAAASQPCEIGGAISRAPAREDLLWHAYAHGFAIHTLCPGWLRLISLADVVHATEAWVDLLDWNLLGRQYPRLVRALAVVSCVVPWSPRVLERLGGGASFAKWPMHPVAPTLGWLSKLRADVLWPGEWWFRMRYGIAGRPDWIWYRAVGHPAAVMGSAAHSVMVRWSGRPVAEPGRRRDLRKLAHVQKHQDARELCASGDR